MGTTSQASWITYPPPNDPGGGAGSGEANTASNVNTGGVGVFKQKVGPNLEFRGVDAASTKITVVLDAPNNEIEIDAADASTTQAGAIEIATQTEVDSQSSALLAVTPATLGATTVNGIDGAAIHDNVAAEISAVTAKATPTRDDFVLIEDAAAGDAKKSTTIDALPFAELVGIASSNPISTIVGTTVFQTKVSLGPITLPAGDYLIRHSYGWNHDSKENDFEGRLLQNSTALGELHKQEPKDSTGGDPTGTTQRYYMSRERLETLSAATYTWAIQYRTDAAVFESSIWEATISVWKVA